MQIYLFMPLLLNLLFKLSAMKKASFLLLLAIIGVVINFVVIWTNNLAAGLFAPQDIDIFRLFVNKPYTKIYAISIGIALAFMFAHINKQKSDQNFSGYFKLLQNSTGFVLLTYLISLGLIAFVTLYPI